jgi:WD40 repeat protein
VRLFDLGKGVEMAHLGGLGEPHPPPALSAGGRRIALLGEKGNNRCVVRLVDGATGKLLLRKELPHDNAVRAALSPDGSLLATGHTNGSVRLWGTDSWKELRRLKGLEEEPGWLAFSPDGQLVAAAAQGRARAQLWEVKTGRQAVPEKDRPEAVGFAFLPDGRGLALILPPRIDRWDLLTRKSAAWLKDCQLHTGGFAISPDGRTVAEGATSVKLHDAATGRPGHPSRARRGSVFEIRYLADGKRLASHTHSTMSLWERASGKEVVRRNLVGCLALSPDGTALVGRSGELRRVDLASGKSLGYLDKPARMRSRQVLHSLAGFSADGRKLAVLREEVSIRPMLRGLGAEPLRLQLFAADTGNLLRERIITPEGANYPGGRVLSLSPGGEMLAATSVDYVIAGSPRGKPLWVWDAATTSPWAGAAPGQVCGSAFAFSPDGTLLLTNGGAAVNKWLELWDLAAGKKHLVPACDPREVATLALSFDGRFAAVALSSGQIVLWDLLTGREAARLDGHAGWVHSLTFSPEGDELASGSGDTTIVLWDVRPLRQRTSTPPAGRIDGDRLWADLAGKDNWAAWRAVWRMGERPRAAVAALRKHLRPATADEEKRLAGLIRDLDSDRFATRESATRELEKLGGHVAPALEMALGGKPSPEQALRIRRLLARIGGSRLPAHERRALVLLESIGDADARRLLRTLAGGAPGATLTLEAKAALDRLDTRRR